MKSAKLRSMITKMSLQERINQEVMLWQLAAFTGKTEDAKKHQEKYMQLVLEKVSKE